jgi:adenylate cyclase
MLANGLGAIDVFLLLWLVLPAPPYDDESTVLAVNAAACIGYMLVSALWATCGASASSTRSRRGCRRAAATSPSARRSCASPSSARGQRVGLGRGGGAFHAHHLPVSTDLAFHVGTTIVMGGVTCCAVTYLLVERVLQPVTAEALVGWTGPASQPRGLGVASRLVLAWVCATGVPLAGSSMLACQALTGSEQISFDRMAWSVVALAAVGLAAGLLATWLVARSIADPLTGVRGRSGRIEQGDLTRA